ncbi:MAG: hypothetical protein LKK13_05345 [Bacilli bacterium]|jgi:galactokinase|nr:hypothetical protein [Bacilli bacterium]
MKEPSFKRALASYQAAFRTAPAGFIFSPGRLEILGNHTDHNHGLCLVAGCNLGIRAAYGPAQDVSLESQGYGSLAFALKDFSPREGEKGSTMALTKGVLAFLRGQGFAIGGFRAALNSDIFPGAGVSSSAAYELFVAEAMNVLYNGGRIDRLTKAKAGQYAENVYFGKASGLLDQCGSSFGGVQYLDFRDPKNPLVEPLPFPEWMPRILLVNPGPGHQGLNDLYGELPRDMRFVAEKVFGAAFLGDVADGEDALARLKEPLEGIPERARLRAIHFFRENERVKRMKEAFSKKDRREFLALERESEYSQEHFLRNVMIPGRYAGSPLECVERAKEAFPGGAYRVMGGGFAGSVICFLEAGEVASFSKKMASFYGGGAVAEASISRLGAHRVA